MGDGLKRGAASYNPTQPPMVQADPGHREEQPEPTPLHEPVVEEEKKDVDGEEGEEAQE